MATLTATNPTLIDVAKRKDPKGKVDVITELLSQTNEILLDATAVECNDGTGHKTTVRTGLPTAAWRKLNYGVPASKSTTAQVRDACGMLETYAKVDKALVEMSGDPQGFRMSEDMAFLESINQTWASTLFYGDTDVNPERFLGLAPRFDDLTTAESKDNILSGGGNGSNTSIWLVGWSPLAAHLIYPEGSVAGVQHRDLGEDTATDAAGGEYQILRTHYKLATGFTLRDWRKVVRIANIKVGDLTKDAATGANLLDLMVQALELVTMGSERWAFYCNRTIRSFLRRQLMNKSNVNLSLDDVAGRKVLSFDGVPVRRCDALLNTEAQIS